MTTQLTDARIATGRHHNREPATETVTAILTAYATGEWTARALSELHGISDSTVRKIVNGETHTDAPGPRLPPERVAELAAAHLAAGRRLAAAKVRKAVCPGCGEPGHPITKCPNPTGKR